ncbi:MAG: YeeE/YedE family protein [Pseudomonadales bacterium]
MSSDVTAGLNGTAPAVVLNTRVITAAMLVSALLIAGIGSDHGWRLAALFLVGLGAGLVLYHAAFGFTAAWRVMITERRSAGLRAQMVMMAVTVAVFLPLLAGGELWGTPLRGSVAPLSTAIIAGAFLFGIGMQLGGGCASGTLFTVGGGSVRMIVTLLAFIAGSVLGAWHWPAWQDAPQLAPFSLLEHFGAPGALGISLGLFGLVWFGAGALERRRHGGLEVTRVQPGMGRWLQGPWPLVAGALGLAAVNIATLSLAGRPWGVTSGFALWGSKAAAGLGIDVASWPYWQRPGPAASLEGSVLADITSVMNFGILLGALAAAGLAGRFAPVWKIPARSLAAAIMGGVLLGYGARIAYGCNIGAYFSGLASASLHGWLWFVAAFAGNTLGVRLRPLFGLDR